MIEWFAKNHVAANLLMVSILIIGFTTARNDIALELMPDFQLRTISIVTVLPAGNPQSIEETITTRIEEAVADLEGIKKISSRSAENISAVYLEIEANYEEQAILSDVKVRVDALNTLPVDAERPVVQLLEVPIQVLGVVLYGDVAYDELFTAATDLREALLRVNGVTQVGQLQAPPKEIHIEVSPRSLERFQLSLADVGAAIQRNAIDVSAGNLRTLHGDILVRSDGQALRASQFANIPILNSGDQVVYLKDIAKVVDGYVLQQVETRYNGLPAISLETYRVGQQNTIEISDKVFAFMRDYQRRLPAGIKLGHYGNTAEVVEDRLSTLISSAIYGGILVLILLSLFLRPAVALWVGIGIPVSFLGGIAIMPYLDLTMNMLTMFAFLLVLGIVVDDAIVTGENIYRHQRDGMAAAEAAILGTKEVAVPVTFGVVTTMVAFAPLLLVEGVLSNFAAQIPLVVIPVLAFSLVESKLILPAHMSSVSPRDKQKITAIGSLQQRFSRGFEHTIIKLYRPFLEQCASNKTITLVTAFAIFAILITSMKVGWLRASFFPQFEDNAIFVSLSMPATTGFQTTKSHIDNIVDVSNDLAKEYVDEDSGESYFRYIVSVSGLAISNTGPDFGSNKGMVIMEFVQGENGMPEGFSIREVQEKLRHRIGDIAGAEKLSLSSNFGDFGRPISVVLYGKDLDHLGSYVEPIRNQLQSYPGVFDIQDNYTSGKEEIQLEVLPIASTLGFRQADIAAQVRHALYGHEAQRIQRGPNELKVMVRYPLEYRSSLNNMRNILLRSPFNGKSLPLSQVVNFEPGQSPTAVYRDKQRRAITISADIDSKRYDLDVLRSDLRVYLSDLVANEAEIEFDMDGQAENQKETNESFLLGFMLVIVMIYALLAIPFKSFGQPIVVMSIIPLAIVGAILGHYIMGLAFSMLSIMGMLGLMGIVVNDSLVLVDYINQKRSQGMELMQAVLTAGETRFRPVMLTSVTTFAGLLPLMLNKSTQAQALIPMAVSLGFGILFATLITLVITPINYLVGHAFKHAILSIVRPLNKNQQPDARASSG